MPLSAGDQLGPYEILSAIGAGGMGEVYKAKDTRLDRTVAIKVLPDHIAKRDDLKARFEREARAVASLNHPNICTLHDIGPGYMVMELIEGESLAARIEKGAIPLDQALQQATQIADALDRAHRAGVTHRDVKPQNIMLTRDGVKVLDFGLAKSQAKPGPTEETLTAVLTTEGTIMGTPQYMAPEQFEGKEADARSDIWAFGAVLYEMVAGQKAFQGKSYSNLLGAILNAEPAPLNAPAWLDRLVKRCLQKDPDDRYQSMRDVVLELRTPPAEVLASAPSKTRWWPTAALAIGLVVTGIGWYSATRPAPPRPLVRLNLEIPAATPLARVDVATGLGANMMALSPDGTRLALTLRSADGTPRLHTRLMHQGQMMPLPGTENSHSPFFSPDGEWIGFFAGGKLKKIAVEGGAAVTLCDAPFAYGGSWGDDGNIIAALHWSAGLSRIPSAGGTPVPITKLSNGEITHRWPQVLPGSQAALFTVSPQVNAAFDDAIIELVSLKTGERKTLHRGGFFPRYVSDAAGSRGTGHLLFLHQSTVFAAPFQPGSLTLAGAPVPILEDVSSTLAAGGDFAFAQNGSLAYLAGKASLSGKPIFWVDISGKRPQPLHAPRGQFFNPRFSPDGKRLAFSQTSDTGQDIWVKDLDRDTASRLSFLPGANSIPVWTPDGKHLVFRSVNHPARGLYAIRSDGSGEAVRLAESQEVGFPTSFSPDGKRLAVTARGDGGSVDIFTFPVEAGAGPGGVPFRLGKAEPFLSTPFEESRSAFSPDGRWLAYVSQESGMSEVYVRPFPGPGGRWQVSAGAAGIMPVWSRDGRELLYVASDGRVMAVDYTAKGDTFAPGNPRVWTETRLLIGSSFDIAPDGKRLAAILADDPNAEKRSANLTFLLNFVDELRRKAPVN